MKYIKSEKKKKKNLSISERSTSGPNHLRRRPARCARQDAALCPTYRFVKLSQNGKVETSDKSCVETGHRNCSLRHDPLAIQTESHIVYQV